MTFQEQTRFDLASAPLEIAHVTLTVRDLTRTGDFYRHALGFAVHRVTDTSMVLGADTPFLTLRKDADAVPDNSATPGLFHTAFLLPDRADLGRWLAHAVKLGSLIEGASDHNVSEAIYLSDPEGNGIELYADRPVEYWRSADGKLSMPSWQLDLASLPNPSPWNGLPAGTRIGHVHLRDPDTRSAEAFWTGLGLEVMARYPGASFFGAGGYHHQLAVNSWQARRNAPVDRQAGLSELTFRTDAKVIANAEAVGASHLGRAIRIKDRHGLALLFVPKEE